LPSALIALGKKKLGTRPDDGDSTFAECHNRRALGKDSNFAECRQITLSKPWFQTVCSGWSAGSSFQMSELFDRQTVRRSTADGPPMDHLLSVLVRALGKHGNFADCLGQCTRQTLVAGSIEKLFYQVLW